MKKWLVTGRCVQISISIAIAFLFSFELCGKNVGEQAPPTNRYTYYSGCVNSDTGTKTKGDGYNRFQEFIHPQTGRKVWLIAMTHIADVSFYDEVNKMTKSADIVLEEGIRGDASGLQHIFFSAFRSIGRGHAGTLGFAPQDFVVKSSEKSVNADISTKDISLSATLIAMALPLGAVCLEPVFICFDIRRELASLCGNSNEYRSSVRSLFCKSLNPRTEKLAKTKSRTEIDKNNKKTATKSENNNKKTATEISEKHKKWREKHKKWLESISKKYKKWFKSISKKYIKWLKKTVSEDFAGLSQRNDYLMKFFDRIIEEDKDNKIKTIICPWGAEHLSGLEVELLKRGYIKGQCRWVRSVALKNIQEVKEVPLYVSLSYLFSMTHIRESTEVNLCFRAIEYISIRKKTYFSMLWGQLLSYGRKKNKREFSLLPKICGYPLLYDYRQQDGVAKHRFFGFLSFKTGTKKEPMPTELPTAPTERPAMSKKNEASKKIIRES